MTIKEDKSGQFGQYQEGSIYDVFCVDGEYGKNTKESRKQVDKEK